MQPQAEATSEATRAKCVASGDVARFLADVAAQKAEKEAALTATAAASKVAIASARSSQPATVWVVGEDGEYRKLPAS